MDEIEKHVAKSIGRYKSGGHASVTTSKKDPMHHAKTNLTDAQIQDFDRFYFSNYPDLAEKYLSRYDTRDVDLDSRK